MALQRNAGKDVAPSTLAEGLESCLLQLHNIPKPIYVPWSRSRVEWCVALQVSIFSGHVRSWCVWAIPVPQCNHQMGDELPWSGHPA